ncbi:MAG: branched-chain amino acid ABC transporter ATP-binding protein/permease [Burkholderiaceae bacterium]|jgi:branched-chain amino acid transport system permease protein
MQSLRHNIYTQLALFSVLYLGAALFVDDNYFRFVLSTVPIWAVMGISWNIFSGYTGLVSFGHAAFFGIGAYTVVILSLNFDVSPVIGIPLGCLGGLIAGVLIGYPTFRLKGVYFALAMLAYPLTLLYIFEWLGYQEPTIPMRTGAEGLWHMQFENPYYNIVVSVAIMCLAVWVSHKIHSSRFGLSLTAIKQNEAAAESAGLDSTKWKLRSIMVSGALAGLAGGWYAALVLVVTPNSVFGMLTSSQAMIVTLFGGVSTVWGPVIGSLVLIPTSEIIQATVGEKLHGIHGVLLGVAIILMMIFAPDGILTKLKSLVFKQRKDPNEQAPQVTPPAAASGDSKRRISDEVMLDVRGISVSFGGLKAVSDVTFQVHKGEVLGIIGPNGAGKTTLFNLLNGFIPATAGEITFANTNLVGLKPNQVCRLGVGRTFQVARSFSRLTVLDNVVVGAFAKDDDDDVARQHAMEALELVGMAGHAQTLAGGLNSLELRLMELARVLAGRPELLLMDETLAGLGAEEVEVMLSTITNLANQGQSIVIIEHTMQAMVRLVDRFIVLNHGTVLATGEPTTVMKDPAVVEAYLGKKWVNNATD